MPRLNKVSLPKDPLQARLAELKRRNEDALRLFRPMDTQVEAIKTRASEVLIRGGNRSGKSILGAAIVASAARRIPLLDKDGNELPAFAPTNRPLLIWVIGKGENHVGDTLYRLLFRPGQFPVLMDQGKLRAARNWDERALGESQKVKDASGTEVGVIAPPFIPKSEIKSISFTKASAEVFDRVELNNGTIICAYNSKGDVKMGDPVDLIWIDEDIEFWQYVAEWQARLSDRKGRLLWTAWPWSDNFALTTLSRRAEQQKHLDNPDVYEQRLSFFDNPFIDEDEKRKRRAAWSESGPSEIASRGEGEFAMGLSLMYPNFSLMVHGLPRQGAATDDHLEATLRKTNWQPPADWARYLTMDPGHATASIGFWAVPPPEEFGNVKIRYDELYLHANTADEIAAKVLPKVQGLEFEDFVIDFRYARQHASGTGKTYLQIYSEAFERAGIMSNRSGTSFTFASDDVTAGIEAFRSLLTVRPGGSTAFRVVQANCSSWVRECVSYKKAYAKDEAQDKPANGQADHAMDETRYAAMHGLAYIKPRQASAAMPYNVFQNFWKKGDDDQAKQPQFSIGIGSAQGSA